jgi:hypothetical protein
MLQGDANTAYFHAVANGRHRKCNIVVLPVETGPITNKRLIQEHIYDFYRQLLGTEATRVCGLAPNSWGVEARVSEAENQELLRTFTEQELESLVMEMKFDTAPGPDGFPVSFFKKF